MAVTDLRKFGRPNIVIDTSKISLVVGEREDVFDITNFMLTIICDGYPFNLYFKGAEIEEFKACFSFLSDAMSGHA